jgi:hypothetical protein
MTRKAWRRLPVRSRFRLLHALHVIPSSDGSRSQDPFPVGVSEDLGDRDMCYRSLTLPTLRSASSSATKPVSIIWKPWILESLSIVEGMLGDRTHDAPLVGAEYEADRFSMGSCGTSDAK